MVIYDENMDQETKQEFNNLAKIIKQGFDGVDERFQGVDEGFQSVNKKFELVYERLDNLERGHGDIKLRLGQVAYCFELEDIDRRLQKVEVKLDLRKT